MFDFNSYSGLLLLGVVQAVVFAVILLFRWRREERLSDAFASIILIVGGLYAAQWMFGFAGWYNDQDWRSTLMFYIEWDQLALLGPFIWLYFRAVTNTDFRWERRFWIHLIPAGIFFVLPVALLLYDFLIHLLILGEPFEGFGGSRGPAMEYKHEYMAWTNTVKLIFVRFQLPVYLVLTLKEYRRYRDYIKNEFANSDELELTGLRNLLGIFLSCIAFAFASDLYGTVQGVEGYVDVWPRYFATSVMVYAGAIQFFRLDARQTRHLRFNPTNVVESSPEIDIGKWVKKLELRFSQHKDYLEPDLKLGDLAKRIGSNASQLSKVINSHYELNFNDLINRHRCEAFMSRIESGEHKHHTLLSLALDSGFNSKSTFNRAFRKIYGFSPGQAIKERGSNDDLGRPNT